MPSREEFVAQMWPLAVEWSQVTGIPPEVYVAMGASETNWGATGTLFGIKGSGSAGTQNYATWEMIDGKPVALNDNFAIYNTPDEAFEHFHELVSSGRYKPAWDHLQETGDWQGFLQGINKAGYATDPQWATKIGSIAGGIGEPVVNAGLKAAEVGPDGRTFNQTKGTDYKSDAEREWYHAQQGRSVPGGGGQMSNLTVEEIAAQAVQEALGGAGPANGTAFLKGLPGGAGKPKASGGANAGAATSVGAAGASPATPQRMQLTDGSYLEFVPALGDWAIMKPRVHPLTGAIVPGEFELSGWRSGADVATAKNAQGAVSEKELRDQGAKMGVGTATLDGKEYRKNADGTYSVSGDVKAEPAKAQSPAQKLWAGLPGFQGNAAGGTAGGVTTGAGAGVAPATASIGATANAPRLTPGFNGAGYNPNEPAPGYDEGGNPIEGWGMVNPSQGGFNQPLSLIQNVAQGRGGADFSQLASAGGLKATGNQAQDAENALAVTNQRALFASMGMGPLEIQRIFDARIGTGNPIKQNLNTGVYGAQTVGGNVSEDPRSSYGFGPVTSTAGGKSYPFNEEELQAMIRAGAVPSFASGGSIGTNMADDDPRIGAQSSMNAAYQGNPWLWELPYPAAGAIAHADQPQARGAHVSQAISRALKAAGAPPALVAGGLMGIMNLPDSLKARILGPMAREYFASMDSYMPASSNPRSGMYNGTIDIWDDFLDGVYGRTDSKYRLPVSIGADGNYRLGPEPQPKASYFDTALSSPTAPQQAELEIDGGPAPPYVPPPPPPPPPAPAPPPYTGPAQLPFDAYRELGLSSETDPFPRLARGGQMMTDEPIIGMGMQSQRPQFVVGEAGPERLDVTPMTGPNAGNYAGGQQQMAPPPTPFAQLLETLFADRRGGGRKPALRAVGSGMI